MCQGNECGHAHFAHHAQGGCHPHDSGCCCGSGHRMRRFPTREEVIGELQEYLKQLQAEAKGVEERIAELGKPG